MVVPSFTLYQQPIQVIPMPTAMASEVVEMISYTIIYNLAVCYYLPVKISTKEGYILHPKEALIYLLHCFSGGVTHATMEDNIPMVVPPL
jgi:hypothetical protein